MTQLFYHFGSKHQLRHLVAPHVLPLLKGDCTYTEPLVGAGAIGLDILGYKAQQRMWLNDKDAAIVALWLAVRDRPRELIQRMQDYPIADNDKMMVDFDIFKDAVYATDALPTDPNAIDELAFQWLAFSTMRYGGKGGGPRGGKKQDPPKIASRWNAELFSDKLMMISQRINRADVRITCYDFAEVIAFGTGPMFLDPPYWDVGDNYRCAFTPNDHWRLADALRKTTRPFVLTYRDCAAVRRHYHWANIETIGDRDTLLITPPTTGSRSGEPKTQGTAGAAEGVLCASRGAGIIASRCSMPLKIDLSKHYYLGVHKDRTHVEWYTPKYIFDALGCEFDLDPASPGAEIVHWIPAREHYTFGGLERKWHGFVFLNPPYDKNIKPLWLDRFIQHGNGIALVPDAIATAWQQNLFNHADLCLYLNKKVKFVNGNGGKSTASPTGTVVVAIGAQGIEGLQRARDAGLGGLQRPVP